MSAARALPERWVVWREPLIARWRALSARDRGAVRIAGAAVGVLLAWLLLVQPALRTLREAPPQIERLDLQLQQMQRLAAEARELRGTAPVSPAQSLAALQAATARLGDKARLVPAADRATVTFTAVSADQLNGWLSEVRSAARARPVELQLTRGPAGYSGTVVVALGGAA